MREGTRLFKSLGNDRRLKIISLLRGRAEMSVGEIAQQLKLSLKSTSRHLLLLEQVGLLNREQRGLEVFYSLNSKLRVFGSTISQLTA
ncbi:MAG: winged helix-turn-helix transcriptional regulator [Candidatus Kerfeldbacteria bacterium]|nr:winged helix-turn-helix transcriptional regulator [Candidatus Kerfeldbacteria bacterium]